MKIILIVSLCLNSALSFCQKQTFMADEVAVSKWIDGTLLTPIDVEKPSLAIIIAGSGPTNRNGNQNFLQNNSLKKLAEGLSNAGIATFRYDKRIVKQIRNGKVAKNIMFDDFISDARDVINFFKAKATFNKIYVIGHSQGSLIGMIVAKSKADGFISVSGAGQNIGDVIIEQATKMDSNLGEQTKPVVADLKQGHLVSDYPSALSSVFNADIQPFMINWMTYNPTEIISELNIPILIINGTKDLQVSEREAKLLKDANENSTLILIEDMNHVLFEIKGDDLENSKSYNESFRPISSKLLLSIINFINT